MMNRNLNGKGGEEPDGFVSMAVRIGISHKTDNKKNWRNTK